MRKSIRCFSWLLAKDLCLISYHPQNGGLRTVSIKRVTFIVGGSCNGKFHIDKVANRAEELESWKTSYFDSP